MYLGGVSGFPILVCVTEALPRVRCWSLLCVQSLLALCCGIYSGQAIPASTSFYEQILRVIGLYVLHRRDGHLRNENHTIGGIIGKFELSN